MLQKVGKGDFFVLISNGKVLQRAQRKRKADSSEGGQVVVGLTEPADECVPLKVKRARKKEAPLAFKQGDGEKLSSVLSSIF